MCLNYIQFVHLLHPAGSSKKAVNVVILLFLMVYYITVEKKWQNERKQWIKEKKDNKDGDRKNMIGGVTNKNANLKSMI